MTKSHAVRGFEVLLNSPASPMTKEGLFAFRQLKKASGLSTRETLKYLGSKEPKPKSKEEAKQDERLNNLKSTE